MRISIWNITRAIAVFSFMSAADAQTAGLAPDSIEGHLAAGKNAAGAATTPLISTAWSPQSASRL